MPDQIVKKMQVTNEFLAFNKFPQLSKRDIAYQEGNEVLKPFYKYDVHLDSFKQIVQNKGLDETDRSLLVQVFQAQYEELSASTSTLKNIELLKRASTFTIVTAHQPSLLTGPLYYIYKIASTINLAKRLNAHLEGTNIIPVFISGAEDHDFEEIQSVSLFNKKITWENDESGSVGKMSTQTLQPVLDELFTILGTSPEAAFLQNLFQESFTKFSTYGKAMQNIVNELFKDYGLLVLDMSDQALKKAFIPHIKKEIFQKTSHPLVSKTMEALQSVGLKGQANPREINFFYTGKGFRSRIEEDNGIYKIIDQDITFSKEALDREIEKSPERFSPNVVMRPIYQEFILPNLAYVGGGGELAYWMERKSQFEAFGLNFPMLIRRNSVLWVKEGLSKKLTKIGMTVEQMLQAPHLLIDSYLAQHTSNEISLSKEKEAIQEVYQEIKVKSAAIDKSLNAKVEADMANHIKAIEKLEQRLKKSEKAKHDVGLRQLEKIQNALFPSGSLQERKDNFIPFYLSHGDEFIAYLVEHLDPLRKEFLIIKEGSKV